MTSRAFRSFTILCLCMTILFGTLGAWQIHRLQWKNELLAQIHEGQQEYIQEGIQENIQRLPSDSTQWQEWRHYHLVGEWAPEQAHIVQPRVRKGIPGGHLFIPLTFHTSTGHTPTGKDAVKPPEKTTLWINLGWISTPFPTKIQGKALPLPKIVIRVRKTRPPHWATPKNRPEKNEWFWPDLDLWSSEKQNLVPVLFYGELASQGTIDIHPDVLVFQIPNRHLEYSITWLSFVVIVIGLWLYMYRKRLG